ncbi:uncharacterized protein M421DRAFT_64860 [Didymella exigua CBS 183.55]|uniref:Rhodopsin domain-containing protein n=1 Tax=Didymella exigua CBS 183.55 TaxID=1150837 RepID=A0A6A5RK72_9PLEO|nr:uncharacterized protein M421DRAFT_64860 [Didymella exigua CBS 183.55]KAF1927660.1 hypothetical protein M421DRAFT_64860 [Didymella exigua CBS 183.55]
MLSPRNHDEENTHGYVNPEVPLNIGLWSLYAGATFFLALRVWIKVTRRHGLWWDDWILLVTWIILSINNSLITIEYATGYVVDKWDDRMQILINITSCGTLMGQALSKTAFAVTLLKLTKGWPQWILWFCIVTMNAYMITKVFFQWARIIDKPSYDVWYRLNFHLDWTFRERFKEGGNVYNIIMDFVMATFPWLITWKLDMRKVEKVGLCLTMSLGMIVAIIAAIRTGWKQGGNPKDEWYFWRNAHSNIWYSSEIVGTIIVQCIPVLRPLLRDIHTSLTSKKLPSQTLGTERRSKMPPAYMNNNGHTARAFSDANGTNNDDSMTDSWDNQGIYTKKDFELTLVEARRSPQSMV